MDCIGGNTVQKTEQSKKTTYILKLCVCARENYISTIISSGLWLVRLISIEALQTDWINHVTFFADFFSLSRCGFLTHTRGLHMFFCYSILKLRFFLFKNDIYNIYNLYSTVLRVIWYLTAYIEGKNILYIWFSFLKASLFFINIVYFVLVHF